MSSNTTIDEIKNSIYAIFFSHDDFQHVSVQRCLNSFEMRALLRLSLRLLYVQSTLLGYTNSW